MDHLQSTFSAQVTNCSPLAGKHRSQILSLIQPTSGRGTGVQRTAPAVMPLSGPQPDQPEAVYANMQMQGPFLELFPSTPCPAVIHIPADDNANNSCPWKC